MVENNVMKVLVKNCKIIGNGNVSNKFRSDVEEVTVRLSDGRVLKSYSFENLWKDERKKVDVLVELN